MATARGVHSTARGRRVKAEDFPITGGRGIFPPGRGDDGRSTGLRDRQGKRYLPVSALDAVRRTMVVKDLFSVGITDV